MSITPVAFIPTTCQWIHDDGTECGSKTGLDQPWCPHHKEIVFMSEEENDNTESEFSMWDDSMDEDDMYDDVEFASLDDILHEEEECDNDESY